jgi:hypothetical protein
MTIKSKKSFKNECDQAEQQVIIDWSDTQPYLAYKSRK